MSKKIIATDPTARTKVLAILALAEAEDSRHGAEEVKPYLKKISTIDLQELFAIARCYAVQEYAINELLKREDFHAKNALELLSATDFPQMKKVVCEATATVALRRKEQINTTTIIELFDHGTSEPLKSLLQIALQGVLQENLPRLLEKCNVSVGSLIIAELKRRDDPVRERVLDALSIDIHDNVRRGIIMLLEFDKRITPMHILSAENTLPDTSIIRDFFSRKLKGLPIKEKMHCYELTDRASFKIAIIGSLYYHREEILPYINDLIEHAHSDEVHASVITVLGPYLPLEKLLELRGKARGEQVTDAFANIFGEHSRYKELQKFLAS